MSAAVRVEIKPRSPQTIAQDGNAWKQISFEYPLDFTMRHGIKQDNCLQCFLVPLLVKYRLRKQQGEQSDANYPLARGSYSNSRRAPIN